jgi:HlyD family secretion protein
MQVLASVDEADVGQIRQGIKANFAVDAYPGETFSGEISQVRLNAQTLQNVVTYSAVIDVANPDMKLRPGMTANITVPVARKEGVLTVPNAALRFKPNLSEKEQEALRQKTEARRTEREAERQAQGGQAPSSDQKPQAQQPAGQGQDNAQPRGGGGGPRQQGEARQSGQTPQTGGAQAGGDAPRQRPGQQIWIMAADGKSIEPRFVRAGLTNGRVTEIVTGDVHEGDIVVTGQNDTSGGNRPQTTTTPLGQRPPTGGGGGRPR